MLKKTIYSVTAVLLLGTACLTYSCSSDYNEPQPASKTAEEQAEDEILSIFIEFNKTLTPIPQSRALTRSGWLSVTCADVLGALDGATFGSKVGGSIGPHGAIIGGIAGGVIAGAAASYLEYDDQIQRADTTKNGQLRANSYESNYPDQMAFNESFAIAETLILSDDYSIGITLDFDSTATKIGILHNKVLDIVEEVNIASGSFTTTALDSLHIAIVTDSVFIAEFQSIIHKDAQTTKRKTISKRIIEEFCDAIKSSCNSTEDLYYIIDQYKLKIHELATEGYESDVLGGGKLFLSIDDVEHMNAALAVAAYSYDYWSAVYPYVEE